jgi:hypothetical protein
MSYFLSCTPSERERWAVCFRLLPANHSKRYPLKKYHKVSKFRSASAEAQDDRGDDLEHRDLPQ